MNELDRHMMESCQYQVSGSESTESKVNILLQTYISKQLVDNFSLVSDMSYVAQVSNIYNTVNYRTNKSDCEIIMFCVAFYSSQSNLEYYCGFINSL